MAEKKVGLAELFAVLRTEIDRSVANLKGSGKDAMLVLKEAEVEVHFVVEKEVKGGGNIEVPTLFAVELSGAYKSENVHKIKVTLAPKTGANVDLAGSPSGD